MLNYRANILFDPQIWKHLEALAKSKNISVGQLVRDAVDKVYSEDEIQKMRAKAFEEIMKIRPHFKGKINYKELINYGRKY